MVPSCPGRNPPPPLVLIDGVAASARLAPGLVAGLVPDLAKTATAPWVDGLPALTMASGTMAMAPLLPRSQTSTPSS